MLAMHLWHGICGTAASRAATLLRHAGQRDCASIRIRRLLQFRSNWASAPSPLGRVLVNRGDDGEDALIAYVPDCLPHAQASALFEFCRDHVPWAREEDDFGPQERLSHYVGDAGCSFAYVGLFLRPQPWPEPLARVREQLNALLVRAGLPRVTACLLNHYPQDEGQIVWHRDEIRAHGPDPVVVSVSLSPVGTRSFMIRSNATQNVVQTRLAHGSAIIMAGRAAQEAWMHRLPLEDPAPQRISLTFRSIVPGLEDALSRSGAKLDDCVSVG